MHAQDASTRRPRTDAVAKPIQKSLLYLGCLLYISRELEKQAYGPVACQSLLLKERVCESKSGRGLRAKMKVPGKPSGPNIRGH